MSANLPSWVSNLDEQELVALVSEPFRRSLTVDESQTAEVLHNITAAQSVPGFTKDELRKLPLEEIALDAYTATRTAAGRADNGKTPVSQQPKKLSRTLARKGGMRMSTSKHGSLPAKPDDASLVAAVKKEFALFLCTKDPKYTTLRRQVRAYSDKTTIVIVSMIAAEIAICLGIAAATIVPICAMLLLILRAIGIQVLCRQWGH